MCFGEDHVSDICVSLDARVLLPWVGGWDDLFSVPSSCNSSLSILHEVAFPCSDCQKVLFHSQSQGRSKISLKYYLLVRLTAAKLAFCFLLALNLCSATKRFFLTLFITLFFSFLSLLLPSTLLWAYFQLLVRTESSAMYNKLHSSDSLKYKP